MKLTDLLTRLAGVNLGQLARLTGLNVRTLRRIRNSGQVPSSATVDSIADGIRKLKRGNHAAR